MIKAINILVVILFLVVSVSAQAQMTSEDEQAKIENAMTAAPPSISQQAAIRDWPANSGEEMSLLREGSNNFTCLPDIPDTPGNDPMCLDAPWMKWAKAWMNKQELTVDRMGFGYMLQGGTAESNTDPYAEGPTEDNEWIEEGVPHLMIIVPDPAMLEELPTDPTTGGPWVMWRNTPYVHIMAPMPKYNPELGTQ
jgi:hypothetical protein